MKKKLFGTGVALITPFKKNGSIDFKGLEKIVEYVSNNNVNYLVVLGTTAESSTLKLNEKIEIINCIQSSNKKKLPIVLGIGNNNTKEVVYQINKIKKFVGSFYAILSVSPYYNIPSQEGIYQHYKYISNYTDTKIIIYNVPKRTGSNILPETAIKISSDLKKVIGIKEASGNILQSYKIIDKKSPNFSLISGDDFITLPIILGGGDGVISVIAQGLPKKISDMIFHAMNKKVKESFSIFYKILDITELVYKEGNPTGIKTLLNIMGICDPYVRLPLTTGTKSLKEKMYKCLKNI